MSEFSDPIAFWNGEAGQRWTDHQATLDAFLQPLSEVLLRATDAQPGERVLDVGCGTGTTTLALADAVGPTGDVLGVDVSQPMLARARARSEVHPHVHFVEQDATTAAFTGDRSLVFSRFGVMFFTDPVRAFANLRTALRPDGRMVFACWQAVAVNPWAGLPAMAVRSLLGDAAPPPTPSTDPGPFSMASAGRVLSLLGEAGWTSVSVDPVSTRVSLGSTLDAATDHALRVGPAARLVADADPSLHERARAAVRQALAPHVAPTGVWLDAAVSIVCARVTSP